MHFKFLVMKKGIFFIMLSFFAYTMISCDPLNGNGGVDPETPKNYWERSARTQLQLRAGKNDQRV